MLGILDVEPEMRVAPGMLVRVSASFSASGFLLGMLLVGMLLVGMLVAFFFGVFLVTTFFGVFFIAVFVGMFLVRVFFVTMLFVAMLIAFFFGAMLIAVFVAVRAAFDGFESFGDFDDYLILVPGAFDEVFDPVVEAESVLEYDLGFGDPPRVARRRLESLRGATDRNDGLDLDPIPADLRGEILYHRGRRRHPHRSVLAASPFLPPARTPACRDETNRQ